MPTPKSKNKGAKPTAKAVNLSIRNLNAGEALAGLFGYLTTRAESLIFGEKHNCAAIAEVFSAFAKANRLPAARNGWENVYVRPTDVDHLTNISTQMAAMALTPQERFEKLKAMFLDFTYEQRVEVIAKLMVVAEGKMKDHMDELALEKERKFKMGERLKNATTQLEDLKNGASVIVTQL